MVWGNRFSGGLHALMVWQKFTLVVICIGALQSATEIWWYPEYSMLVYNTSIIQLTHLHAKACSSCLTGSDCWLIHTSLWTRSHLVPYNCSEENGLWPEKGKNWRYLVVKMSLVAHILAVGMSLQHTNCCYGMMSCPSGLLWLNTVLVNRLYGTTAIHCVYHELFIMISRSCMHADVQQEREEGCTIYIHCQTCIGIGCAGWRWRERLWMGGGRRGRWG